MIDFEQANRDDVMDVIRHLEDYNKFIKIIEEKSIELNTFDIATHAISVRTHNEALIEIMKSGLDEFEPNIRLVK